MSQTTELSEKCDLKILEENLDQIKECGEYIQKSYEDVKKKIDEIIKKDRSTDEFKTCFEETLKLLKNICKETINRVRNVEENSINKTLVEVPTSKQACSNEKSMKEVEVEKETSKKPGDKKNQNEHLNGPKDDNCSENGGSKLPMVQLVVSKEKDNEENIENNSETGNPVEVNGLKETETLSEKQSESESIPMEKESEEKLDKENEKPQENALIETKCENESPPKGTIRLVSIEKLLDPSIAAFQKRAKKQLSTHNFFNTNVIVLDSDEDESPISIAPSKSTSGEKIKENESSTTKFTSKGYLEVNKSAVSDRNNLNANAEKSNKNIDTLKKASVRIKTNKLVEKLLRRKKSKIKLTEELLKKMNNPVDEELFKRLTSEAEIKKDKSRESVTGIRELRRKFTVVSSDSDEDNNGRRRKLNRTAATKARTKIKEKCDIHSDSSSEKSDSMATNKHRNSSKKSMDINSSSEDESVASLVKKVKKSRGQTNNKEESDNDTSRDAENRSERSESSKKKEQNFRKTILSSSSDEENKNKSNDSKKKKDEQPSDRESDKDEDNSDSDSDFIRKKRKKSKSPSGSESLKLSDDDMDEGSETEKKKAKKRRRIRNANDSESSSNEKDNPNKKRKNIRKVLKTKDLLDNTKKATKEEEERRKRIEERQKLYNQIYEKPENVELKELVLDFDEESKEPLLSVDSGLLKKLKPHQAAGIKFMWDACFETLKDTRNKPGSGCILAHCMGLGKTLQVIALTHALLTNSKKTKIERVLVITPLSTLNNWAKEYIYWMKFCKNKNIEVYDMSKWREKNLRVHKINEWFEEGGVCIIGYDMYRILSNPKSTTIKKKQRESLQKCLVEPGPDLVVCDEGHLLKNEKTSLSQAVNRMKTMRRIVLTGTPLQNNLKEYYCMIQFIKPNLLGTYKEYLNRFVNPITNGQYTDSTARDIQLMKHRSHVLHKLLEGCIQRRDYSVLAPYLPPKHEYVVFITLTEMQKKLYEFYMTKQRDVITENQYAGKGAMLFQDFQNLRRIWTHPMCLRVNSDSVIRKRLAKDDSDSEGSLRDFIDDNETSSSSSESSSNSSDSEKSEQIVANNPTNTTRRRTRRNPDGGNDSELDLVEEEQKDDPSEWWKPLCPEEELNNINHSPKLLLLMEILQSCEAIGDKILLFSQSLQSLDVIEHFLSLIDKKTQGDAIEGDVGEFIGSWIPGVDYFRLDGSSTVESREAMCRSFNDVKNLRARLFLISTRAGSLGINLVAANRVIIFDVSWNPSHDTQSIFRVYRFGQEKPCYVYRFISLGTMEQKVYERQVAKQATAKRVVDEQQIGRHYNQSDLLELYKYELEPSTPREVPALPKDRLFADLLTKCEKLIFKYHEHDSLLENEESENLSEEERKAAWAEYEAEKERPAQQYIAYNRSAFGNPNGPVTSNKLYGIRTDILLRLLNLMVRRDHPALNDTEVVRMVPVYLQRLNAQMNNNDASMYRELLDLHSHLEIPPTYYMNPAVYMNAPMMALNPMAFRNPTQDQFINQPPPSNSSTVYEIE